MAAEYEIGIPSAGPFPEWRGATLPVTQRSGGVEFTLLTLRDQPGREGLPQVRASFRYREHGRETGNWRPEEVVVSDATGNSLRGWGSDESTTVSFAGLCRREPAWKLRVRFVREDPSQAPADFLWNVPVAAPARNRVALPHSHTRHEAVELRVGAVIGGGDVSWKGVAASFSGPCVMVQAKAPASRFGLALLRATDERGRPLILPTTACQELQAGEADYQFMLPYSARTRKLHLTFGLFRMHTVEFLVKPNPGRSAG